MKKNNIRVRRTHVWSPFVRLLTHIHIPWLKLALCVALSLGSAKAYIFWADYQQRFFSGDLALQTILIGLAALGGSALLAVINNYFGGYLRNTIARNFRDSVWHKAIHLPISAFETMNPNELISRTTNDTRTIGDSLVTVVTTLITTPFTLYWVLVQLYGYHPMLAYSLLVLVPLFIIEKLIQGRIDFTLSYKYQFRLAELTELLSERLINIPLIKIFSREKEETEKGEANISELNRVSLKMQLIGLAFTFLDSILETGTRIFAVLYGGYLVKTGVIDIGVWIAYFAQVALVYSDLNQIITQWPLIKGVQGAITRVADIMEMPNEELEGAAIEEPQSDYVFDKMVLKLGGKTILDEIDLRLPRGKKIAFVGPSGAGKTSLINALERFYTPESGEIRLGQQNINTLDMHSYRRGFAYVPQETILFNDSLRYNLTYGLQRQVTDDEIWAACQAAQIADFIQKQPQGLDTMIAEGGSNLSGGERQRLAIARAFLSNAEVILLDEATANMDAEAEHNVLAALRSISAQRTLIMIAHNLKLVQDADIIHVLDEGKLMASGRHAELIESCPTYQRLQQYEAAEA